MSKIQIFLFILILGLGLVLRLKNYNLYPQRGATSDEYTYTFLGISLITKQVPSSWSSIAAYKNKYDLTIRELYFPMVYPYFDHPPLNGLLVGGWAILNGQTTFESVDLKTVRPVPIFLSVISSILIFLIGRKLFDYQTAIWALLIYSTATIFVMHHRVVLAENLLTPLLLASLYIFLTIKKLKFKNVLLLGIISGLSFWTKELGITVFFTLVFLFLEKRVKPKFVILLTVIFLAFFAAYIGYGYLYDGSLFWQVIDIQSQRKVGPDTLMLLFTNPVIVNKPYLDGWYLVGFLSIFITLFDYKKYKNIIIPAVIYLILMLFSLAKEGEMGWYMIPLFPFMALSCAALLRESLKQKSWYILLLILFVGFYQITYIYEANFGLVSAQFRIMLILMFAPTLGFFLLDKERFFNKIVQAWFYILIAATILLTFTYIHPA